MARRRIHVHHGRFAAVSDGRFRTPPVRVACVVALAALFVTLSLAGVAHGGGSYFEGFNDAGETASGGGPTQLIERGWVFRNQSEPQGSGGWFGLTSEAYEGTAYLAVNYASSSCTTNYTATLSSWAIVPSVAGQEAGDVMSFFVRGGDLGGRRIDRVQVRYSPSGGTRTGSGANDVGDFTELLLDWQSEMFAANPWQQQRITLPGPGRVAFRYFVPDSCLWAYLLRIDALTIGTPPPGPVPLPQAGQTVVWPQSASPIAIEGRMTIPAGGTVVIEPGVEIRLAADSTLAVEGTLRGAGTAAAPIRVTAAAVFPPALDVTGTLDLQQASVGGQVHVGSGASISFADSTFKTFGTVTNAGIARGEVVPAYVQIDRSRFDGVDLYVDRATVVLRDVVFQNANAIALNGEPIFRGVTVDHGKVALNRDGQPVFVNDVTVTNSPGVGLELSGANFGNDFLLGPSVVLSGNQFPVSVNDGGLLPGSNVPATGNVRNAVLADSGDARGPVTWADVGVPYEITDRRFVTGQWRILPGVTVRLGPGAAIFDKVSALSARGTEEAPITFERLDPTRSWWRFDTPGRLEHVVVDGSQYGLIYGVSRPPLYVDSSVLRNNERAIIGSTIIRGSQFFGNTTGAVVSFPGDLNGSTNPNSFVGNGLAVASAQDARYNWWGSPSGPSAGDVASGVPVSPFLTAAPNFADSPPVVRLRRPAALAEPGEKVALSWTASDDSAIVRQRIVFSRAGDSPADYSVLAELPATQRTFQWTVPEVGFQVTGQSASIRIEAADDAGQIGWDAASPSIPSGRVTNRLTITSDLTGPFRGGTTIPVCYSGNTDTFVNSVEGYLFLDGDQRVLPLGGMVAESGCLGGASVPFVSTDSARVGLLLHGSTNDFAWTFSQPFSIRADRRVGDAAPSVALASPAPGQTFPAGAAIPLSWSASDDEGVRGFDIQASYDGGRSWHEVVRDLPAATTSYSWQTPSGDGLGTVRLRVVARDLRFQNSSAAVGISVAASPTTTPPPSATDTVTITTAEYRTAKRNLRVAATSTSFGATLTVRETATNALIGTLAATGGGTYSATFSLPANPGRITVTSSRGGSASASVVVRK